MKSFKIKKYNQKKFLQKKEKSIEERYSKLSPLSIEAYLENKNVYLIDTRNNTISKLGYLPNSLILPLTMQYQKWLPSVVKNGSNVVLICDKKIIKNHWNKRKLYIIIFSDTPFLMK